MKPKNFPERKNARRKAALAKIALGRNGVAKEMASLNASIAKGSLRDARSKKAGGRELRISAHRRKSA